MIKILTMLKITTAIALGAATAAFADVSVPVPSPEHKRLELFVGNWQIDGELAGKPLHVKQACEWFDGSFAVICKAGESGHRNLSIVTYNPHRQAYGYWTINSTGLADTQIGTIDGNVWSFLSDGGATRATVTPLETRIGNSTA